MSQRIAPWEEGAIHCAPTLKGGATMSSQPLPTQDSPSADEIEMRALYRELLDAWNKRDADAFAALFALDGDVVGFDGSQMSGRAEIASTLGQIFADHPTGAYVSQIRGVRRLS